MERTHQNSVSTTVSVVLGTPQTYTITYAIDGTRAEVEAVVGLEGRVSDRVAVGVSFR